MPHALSMIIFVCLISNAFGAGLFLCCEKDKIQPKEDCNRLLGLIPQNLEQQKMLILISQYLDLFDLVKYFRLNRQITQLLRPCLGRKCLKKDFELFHDKELRFDDLVAVHSKFQEFCHVLSQTRATSYGEEALLFSKRSLPYSTNYLHILDLSYFFPPENGRVMCFDFPNILHSFRLDLSSFSPRTKARSFFLASIDFTHIVKCNHYFVWGFELKYSSKTGDWLKIEFEKDWPNIQMEMYFDLCHFSQSEMEALGIGTVFPREVISNRIFITETTLPILFLAASKNKKKEKLGKIIKKLDLKIKSVPRKFLILWETYIKEIRDNRVDCEDNVLEFFSSYKN
jgi:hypothetical protein